MLVAQISDFHVALPGSELDQRRQTAAHLARVVARLTGLDPRPDLVLCTGDLVHDGQPGEYQRLRELLAPLAMPTYVIPGNHDEREALRAAFFDRGYMPERGRLHYSFDAGPLRVICLDTLIPGEPGGRVGGAQLDWLDARLCERTDLPTLICMHHPPFPTGIVAMDAMGLADADALAAVVRRHPQVERVLCGHLHRPIVARFAGTLASTCPSTGPQVTLDLRGAADRIRMGDGPAAYQLHLWRAGFGLVSHVAHADEPV